MTGPRHTRAPRTRCEHKACPYLTRELLCPLHRATTTTTKEGTR